MEGDKDDSIQQSTTDHPNTKSDGSDYNQSSGSDPPYSPFEFDDYYNYRASGMDYDQYYQNFSDSNSDEEERQQAKGDGYSIDGPYGVDHSFGGHSAYSRFSQMSNSEEEDGKEPEAKLVDPGAFQYNKRVFITALPCLLLMLIMTGETLLLMVTIGGLLIVLMGQIGENVSKRCVVVFALLFIPCHILVIGTVLPLLWLSVWNVLLVALVNVFCALTGGWIIVHFEAFRMEEPSMCAMIERALFSVYPCVCSALVTWILSTVVYPHVTPFLFICIWFVYLQLYLMPTKSSFKRTDKEDEDISILRQPTVMTLVIVFTISGPVLHIVLTFLESSSVKLWSLHCLALLAMLLCLGLFLSTLLNLRQLCEHWGWRHQMIVQARWMSGAGMVLLCYPVLQQQGIFSHFLLYLPVAVAGFAALGLSLSLKQGKVLPLLLMAVLMLLLCLWLNHLPWTLTYYLLGVVPLKAFYALVTANFVLCVIAIYASWHSSRELFGSLLLLQSIGLTVGEVGLYQAGLYSMPAFQLTGVLAAYTLHRLYLANKLTQIMAALTSAVQLMKTAIGVVTYLVKEGGRVQTEDVEISTADFLTLLLLVGVLVWLFMYDATEEVSLLQAGKHVTALMVSLGVSGQSFLVPLGDFLLQDDLTLADLVGLWYGLGGALMVLYALQHSQCEGLMDQLMKVAVVMGGVGALVMVMQPQFLLTFYALCQWGEVFSVLLMAALLATRVEMSLTKILMTAGILGICPGIHITLFLYGEIPTVLHFVLISALSCHVLALLFILVKVQEVTNAVENAIKLGAVMILSLLVAVLSVDLINYEYIDSVWDYPAWTVMLAVTASISLCLKALAMKLGPHHLPLVKKEDHSLPLVPVISNTFTVSTLLLAVSQGPYDVLLHDLFMCAASLFLICLQRDSFLLSSLSPGNRATPTVLAAVGTLVISTLMQSQLWHLEDTWGVLLGLVEVMVVLGSLPVYVVLAGILWRGEIWSEKAVVFSMPLNILLVVVGTSFTSWVLCVTGFVCGIGMMALKLPMLPKNFEPVQR